MNNMALMERQAAIKDRPHQFLSIKSEPVDFRAKNIPFLSNISEIGLTALMGKAKTVRYLRKAVLGSEGYKVNAILVIFSGEVRVVSGDDWEYKEVTFRIHEPQSGFGRIALLTDEMSSASVVTLEKTVFAAILKHDFKNWLMNCPGVKFSLL
jgi:CRP-like cAMP-binding protein